MEQEQKRMPKRAKRAIFAALCVAAALLCFFIGWFGHYFSIDRRGRALLWAIDTAERKFYREVDEDKLYEDLFGAVTGSLDIYSAYYTKEEYAEKLSSNQGNGADTGVYLSPYDTDVRVLRVAGNSPAERAGIRRGMYITGFGADENHIETGTKDALLSFVRGQEGSFVFLCGYEADGSDAALYRLAGETYRVAYCEYRDNAHSCRFSPNGWEKINTNAPLSSLADDTAYVRIDEFYGTAAEEFKLCLAEMKACGKRHLVLDLRLNGGGYLSVFGGIASYLMRNAEGKTPVAATTKNRAGKTAYYRAEGNYFSDYFEEDSKIYLLADERTASASECLIGAMISYGTLDYGDIFLREEEGVAKTYGKGIGQSHYTDPQGNVLKLTDSEIFWPNGTSIHGKGVTKEDGAIGVISPLLPAAEDSMLERVLTLLQGG